MAWHGFVLVEVTGAISLTVARRADIERELRRLITLAQRQGADYPPFLLQVRWRDDKQAALLEGNFDTTSRAAFVGEVARALGLEAGQVDANISITILGRPNGDWDESREAALSYLAQHFEAWGMSRSIRVPPADVGRG
jgi:hypothetical protein